MTSTSETIWCAPQVVEHLLRFGDSADERAREPLVAEERVRFEASD
jgi:hypothetical protein